MGKATQDLNPINRWAALRAVLRGEPLVKQNDAQQAIQVIEDRVPIRQVIPRIAMPPGLDSIPAAWAGMYLGPGSPPLPMWGQQYWDGRRSVDNIDPRTIEYPPNVNATIQPRIGYGLMAFTDIEAYAHVPPVAKCRRMIIDEIKSLQPQILDADGNEVDDPDLKWMTTYPDRTTPWTSWIAKYLYNSIVYDAPACQPVYSSDGAIMGMKVIDGSTIFVMIDEHGNTPEPNAPAYAQIIWGTQFIWMSADQLWYWPKNATTRTPYGLTVVEDAIQPIQTISSMWDYTLKWYTEGTTPEDSMTMPPDWTPDQVREFQAAEDAELAGNAKMRRRRRYYPYGVSIVASKNAYFDQPTYDAASAEIELMHGIPPAEMGRMPGQGLGGRGMAEAKATQFYRLAIEPNIHPVQDLFTRALRYNGYDQYTFALNYPTTSIDPATEHASVIQEFEYGVISRDEARSKLGYSPMGGALGAFVVDPNARQQGQDGGGMGGLGGDGSKVRVFPGAKVPINTDGVPVSDKIRVNNSNAADTRIAVKGHGAAFPKAVADGDGDAADQGGMVALFVPTEVADRLHSIITENLTALPTAARIEPAENLHVSLAVFDEISADVPILAAMQITALSCPWPVLAGRIGGYGVFVNGDEKVIYASLDAIELPGLRQALCDHLEELGVPYARDHGFIPHITLAYVPLDSAFSGIDLPEMDVAIDGLTLAQGPYDKITITFGEGFTRMGKAAGNGHLAQTDQLATATLAHIAGSLAEAQALNDFAAELTTLLTKHLPGKHDQAEHGAWAHGRAADKPKEGDGKPRQDQPGQRHGSGDERRIVGQYHEGGRIGEAEQREFIVPPGKPDGEAPKEPDGQPAADQPHLPGIASPLIPAQRPPGGTTPILDSGDPAAELEASPEASPATPSDEDREPLGSGQAPGAGGPPDITSGPPVPTPPDVSPKSEHPGAATLDPIRRKKFDGGINGARQVILADGTQWVEKENSAVEVPEEDRGAFQDLDQADNEVDAYRIGKLIDANVPETVKVAGTQDTTRQAFVKDATVAYDADFSESDVATSEAGLKIGVLDFVMGNWDRHQANYMISDEDQTPWAIDNGIGARGSLKAAQQEFGDSQSRDVIYDMFDRPFIRDNAGNEIPPDVLKALGRVVKDKSFPPGFRKRAKLLIDAGYMPAYNDREDWGSVL